MLTGSDQRAEVGQPGCPFPLGLAVALQFVIPFGFKDRFGRIAGQLGLRGFRSVGSWAQTGTAIRVRACAMPSRHLLALLFAAAALSALAGAAAQSGASDDASSPVPALDNWRPGRATFYGAPGDIWSIHDGSCTHQYIWPDIGTGGWSSVLAGGWAGRR